jgi:hypothetical protein
MLKGINLSLYIGPVVPIPVSQDVIDALVSLKVTTKTSMKASGFELTFNVNKTSPLHTLFLLSGQAMLPFVRVMIVVTINSTPEVLIDGVVTHTQVGDSKGGGTMTLTVIGEDLSRVMDYIAFTGLIPYPAMPAEARVALIVAKYAVFGLIPLVIPSMFIDIPLPTEQIPYHQGTDLSYVRRLAARVGYVFFVESGPVPGVNIAYWGPMIKVGPAQPALNFDMDAETNIESVSCSYSADQQEMPVVMIQNALTKFPIPIPIPAVNPLRPPLGLIPPLPKSFPIDAETAKENFGRALLKGLARAAKSADAVTVTGTLDVLRYGRTLKARQLVGLRGVGPAFEGLYFVSGVTHTLQRGEYKQSFTLSRNGLLSTLREVPA